MGKRGFDRLSRREREIINAVFALGNNASVEEIRGRLDAPPTDSSVRVMLSRLESKGVVRRQRDRGAAVIMSTHDMGDAQTLCDRILLIDKGRRLLYGPVDRVREAFSDGAVEVTGRDLPTDPASLRSVVDLRQLDGTVRYVIRDGASPRDLFGELAASGADVERFAVQAPSLDEIFLRTVAGDPRALAVR